MGRYVTVSVKIPREIKERLDRLGVKTSDLLRRAIMEELRRREVEEVKKEIEELRDVLERISSKFVVESIREDRDSR